LELAETKKSDAEEKEEKLKTEALNAQVEEVKKTIGWTGFDDKKLQAFYEKHKDNKGNYHDDL